MSLRQGMVMNNFSGSKLALFIGEKLLVYLRDEREGLIYSGMWDLPGGGKEGNETPEECVLRELKEEFALELPISQLKNKSHQLNKHGNQIYFFVAHCAEGLENEIQFGDEGQCYRLVDPKEFINEHNAIPHLKSKVREYLHGAS
jgi:8-oxo-dGTP diphosphatase